MTSTDAAKAIFDTHILSLARDAGVVLDWAPTLIDGSYFRAAVPPQLVAEAMDSCAAANLDTQLTQLWADQPQLLAMIPDIMALAATIADEQAISADMGPDAPSTLVYQMW